MAGDQDVDLHRIVEQWGQEYARGRQLSDLQPSDDVEWMSLAEAEKRAGVSRSTLRAWYRSGHIASRLMPGPHGLQRLVPLAAVLERSARSPRKARRASSADVPATACEAAPAAPSPAPPAVIVPASDAIVRLAEIATATATERALAAEARAAEAEAALHSALERAAAAEAELRLLRSKD